MRKVLVFFLLILFSVVLLVATNRNYSNRIYSEKWKYSMGDSIQKSNNTLIKKIKNVVYTSDRFRMGDLYGMSFISKFRKRTDLFTAKKINDNRPASDLYIYGDSFGADKDYRNAFYNIRNVYFIDKRFNSTIQYPVDKNINNIFINEATERNIYPTLTAEHAQTDSFGGILFNNMIWKKLEDKIFHPFVEQNLEMLMFDYSFLSKVKELKANLLLSLFKKTDKQVSISKDRKRLYLEITTNQNNNVSSTYPLTNLQIEKMVSNLNDYEDQVYKHHFNDYYLTIIPNSITINEFKNLPYNYKIQRIEGSKLFK